MSVRFVWIGALSLLLLSPERGSAEDDEAAAKAADRQLRIEINEAIDDGVEWLLSRQKPNGSFPSIHEAGHPMGPTALALLTLLHGGVPRSDPAVQKGFEHLRRPSVTAPCPDLGSRFGTREWAQIMTSMRW